MTIRYFEPNGNPFYEIRTRSPRGPLTEKLKFSDTLKTQAARERWARNREAELTRNGLPEDEVLAPTFGEFAKRFIDEYAVAEGNKPSTIDAKNRIVRLHL